MISNTEALQVTIDHLQDHWFDPNRGIVAASIFNNKDIVTATSYYDPKKKRWVHAERASVDTFTTVIGRPPGMYEEAVVTLSPCILDLGNRVGSSCADLLSQRGIHRVSFGHLDSIQQGTLDYYKQIGLKAELTGEQEDQKICAQLFDLFSDLYSESGRFHYLLSALPNPWAHIKYLIGIEPFRTDL